MLRFKPRIHITSIQFASEECYMDSRGATIASYTLFDCERQAITQFPLRYSMKFMICRLIRFFPIYPNRKHLSHVEMCNKKIKLTLKSITKFDNWRVACCRPQMFSVVFSTGEGRGENGELPWQCGRCKPLCVAAAAGVVVCDCAQCHTWPTWWIEDSIAFIRD